MTTDNVGTAADLGPARLGRILHAWAGALEAGSMSPHDTAAALRDCAQDLMATRSRITPPDSTERQAVVNSVHEDISFVLTSCAEDPERLHAALVVLWGETVQDWFRTVDLLAAFRAVGAVE